MEHALKKIQDRIQKNLKLKKKGGGSKYFVGARRGEAQELAADLASNDKDRQKAAVKRIIASMTLGRDVSNLFVDVIKLGQTLNIELKKLVYLYIISTARLQPDKALMAVNTFLQDTTHQSPIVRALAVRTMMCVRVADVTEYTLEPLRRAAADKEPYVRKAAALGVGKLYHSAPGLFADQGFDEVLMALVMDDAAVVASNAAMVMCELLQSGAPIQPLSPANAQILAVQLSRAGEWGIVYLLELLANTPNMPPEDAEALIVKALPFLGHTNSAVVMAGIKVIAAMYPRTNGNNELLQTCANRINSALLTLAKADAETQYVVCRNVQVLLVLFPGILANNIDSFFIRYNDPPYVKLEKLQLLLKLTTPQNAKIVVDELIEYTSEVDVMLVKEVVSAFAKVALKVDTVASECSEVLVKLARRRPEMLPAILNASKNIVRRYPHLLILDVLIKDHDADSVAEEEAKVSFVWMLGEFCDFIEGGQDLLQGFIDTLLIQEPSVQLALLSAIVKLFLRNPDNVEAALTTVLETLTRESRHPDIRDRAYAYWRLLSHGVGVDTMKRIVHGQKPPVDVDRVFSDGMTWADLRLSLNTAAAVYGKPPRCFLPTYGLPQLADDDEDDDVIDLEEGQGPEDTTEQTEHVDPFAENFAGSTADNVVLNDVYNGNGLHISAAIVSIPFTLQMNVSNTSGTLASDFDLQINKNTLGIIPAATLASSMPQPTLAPGESVTVALPLHVHSKHTVDGTAATIEVGLKCSLGLVRFHVPFSMLQTAEPIDGSMFATQWQNLPTESKTRIPPALAARLLSVAPPLLVNAFTAAKLALVTFNYRESTLNLCGSARLVSGFPLLYQCILSTNPEQPSDLLVKCPVFPDAVKAVMAALEEVHIDAAQTAPQAQTPEQKPSIMTFDDLFN